MGLSDSLHRYPMFLIFFFVQAGVAVVYKIAAATTITAFSVISVASAAKAFWVFL